MKDDPDPPTCTDDQWKKVKSALLAYQGSNDRQHKAAVGIANAMDVIQKDYSYNPKSVAINSGKVAARFAVGLDAFMQLTPAEGCHPNLFSSINQLKDADDIDAQLVDYLHSIRKLSNKASLDKEDYLKVIAARFWGVSHN